jgi:hypothetical protein
VLLLLLLLLLRLLLHQSLFLSVQNHAQLWPSCGAPLLLQWKP